MRKIHIVFLLVTLILTNSILADADKTINIALIADKASGLDKSSLVSLLEVELSKLENIKLLERGEVEKVLAEKKLQLSFEASANESRIQIGNILGADVILFIKKITGPERQEIIDARIVETRTGVILDDVLQDSSDIGKDIQVLIKAISPGLLKANVPLSQRHYLGISDIRNEEPGRELNSIATALTQLLKHDLNSSKNIVVLEREQLNYLLNERNLAGVNVQLRASTIILEGGIRRNGSTKEYSVSLKFIEPSGGKTKDVAIIVPSSDMAIIRQEICKAIISALDDTSEFKISGDSHAEAAYFLKRATSCSIDLAVRLNNSAGLGVFFAETALALDENNIDLRNEVCHCLLFIAENDQSISEEERLNVCKRAHEIDLGTMERYAHLGTKYITDQTYYYLFKVDIYQTTSPSKPSRKEYSELLSEIHNICLKKFYLLNELFLKENKSPIYLLAIRLQNASGSYETLDGLCKDIKSFILEYENYPSKNQIGIYEILANTLNPEWHRERNKKIFPLLEWLSNRSDPTIKLLSYYAMVHQEIDNNDAAIKVCDLLFFEGAKDVGYASMNAILKLNQMGKLENYFENILTLSESGQIDNILKYPSAIREFIQNASKEKQNEWSERIRFMLDTSQASLSQTKGIEDLKANLNSGVVKKSNVNADNNLSPWANYNITPIPISGRDPKVHQRLVWFQVDRYNKKIVLFWRVPVKKREQDFTLYDYIVTNIDASGGRLNQIGKIENQNDLSIKCSDSSSENIFLGIATKGFIMIGSDGIETIGEAQGCFSNDIRSMACLDNNLYLGFLGGLVKFNPKTKTFEILASNKAVQIKNDLDGGMIYWISSMTSDTKNNSLWFVVSNDKNRNGIWQFIPSSGQFKMVYKSGISSHIVVNDKSEILFSYGLLNTLTGEVSSVRDYSDFEDCLREYRYKCCVMIGNDIFNNGWLYSNDGKVYGSSKSWSMIDVFDSGFIAAKYGDNVNELWFVQPKDKAK
jgi:hypothetical protein